MYTAELPTQIPILEGTLKTSTSPEGICEEIYTIEAKLFKINYFENSCKQFLEKSLTMAMPYLKMFLFKVLIESSKTSRNNSHRNSLVISEVSG